jgi:alkyl sulfatase BDS1-like metallo-beta-lactamase superfamily hydrolase
MTSEEDMKNFFGRFPTETFADNTCQIFGAYCSIGVVKTEEGLVVFDLSINRYGRRVLDEIRKFSDKPIKYIIYSHGHFDHAFGFANILEEIKEKGWEMPQVIAHENILKRFEKYRMLHGYHNWLNKMQFSSSGQNIEEDIVSAYETLDPSIVIRGNANYQFTLGNYSFEVYHDKGETDDSLWMWFPDKKVLFTGDLVINPSFPNVGNPNKVQRYPKQWAIAMEKMLEKNAEYLVPGHGLLIEGKEEVTSALSIRAEAMHFVHDEVVKRMNEGKWFEQIYHEMEEIQPEKFKNHKYMRPSYGCYRFAIHAVYRLYHGWYNSGNPTDLFPSKSSDIAKEFLKVADGNKYLERAKILFNEGKNQLALHLTDVVINGSTLENETLLEAYTLKSQILEEKIKEESAFIAQNSYLNGLADVKDKIRNSINKP